MTSMRDRLVMLLQQPFGPVMPWIGIALGLLLVLLVVRGVGVAGAASELERVEKEWVAARQLLMRHREARKAKTDLAQVWAMLPAERDFSPLALGISEEAKRDRVNLPALSYRTEPTTVANTSKGLLQGSMSGRYEDLRRFIYDLETAEEFLLIEDIELARSSAAQGQTLTFNIKIATYLRADAPGLVGQETSQ
ncbi:MAG: type 4a pilus biogenesis protein PilO [Nitrospira sp.]|nr:type 4a pilus biogenesis protein PilO [Nitrospira sp.]